MSVHRYIPAGRSHGEKTACGIRLKGFTEPDQAIAEDGYELRATPAGQPFDCKRCQNVRDRSRQ